jgi:hypothetical protein
VTEEQRWYPIDKLPMFESMVTEGLDYTLEQYALFAEAREKPHVLDDATIDRGVRVFQDQIEETTWHDQQIARWRKQGLTERQRAQVDKLEAGTKRYRDASKGVLALLEELRKGTINRILEMDDGELGLNVLLGKINPPFGGK